MKFSVVIPAFNAAKTISSALDSCFQQTYPPDEIIVVSDGSFDETVKVVTANYATVRMIDLPQNQGVANARNKGIEVAKNDFIAFLDADDNWAINKLELIQKVWEKKPHIELLAHSFQTSQEIKKDSTPTPILSPIPFWKALLQNKAQGSSLCLRKSSGLRFNPVFRYCEDHELAVRAAHQKTYYFMDTILTFLGRPQLSKGGLSGNRWAMRKGELEIYWHLGQFGKKFVPFIPLLVSWSLLKHLFSMSK